MTISFARLGPLAALLTSLAAGAVAQQETIAFESHHRGRPVQVTASISWPSGSAVVPAMVIHHGSAGINQRREGRYARALLAMGVAAVQIDSFGPRGVRQTVTDQMAVDGAEFNLDAIGALKALARHPRIHRRHIGIMGFSKGAVSALMVSHERLLRDKGLPEDLRYALHVPIYPTCYVHYHQPRTTGAPIYLLLGGADTYAGVEPCTSYGESLRRAGARIEVKVYPGAPHGFDGGVAYNTPSGENYSRCVAVQRPDGTYVERTTGAVVGTSAPDGWLVLGPQAMKVIAGCRTLGVSGGPNEKARVQAMEDFKGYVRRHLLGG
ncbi:MAG: dienelactone hydrolase family protein [Alphaproteobacteria bacterium]|nr:dienelactone hydrolase family protein [Alphaproteobacteria bacterium]MCW5738619.1 dienelactone hydrolase family protein [Alphaproteobacteria bacterium]